MQYVGEFSWCADFFAARRFAGAKDSCPSGRIWILFWWVQKVGFASDCRMGAVEVRAKFLEWRVRRLRTQLSWQSVNFSCSIIPEIILNSSPSCGGFIVSKSLKHSTLNCTWNIGCKNPERINDSFGEPSHFVCQVPIQFESVMGILDIKRIVRSIVST